MFLASPPLTPTRSPLSDGFWESIKRAEKLIRAHNLNVPTHGVIWARFAEKPVRQTKQLEQHQHQQVNFIQCLDAKPRSGTNSNTQDRHRKDSIPWNRYHMVVGFVVVEQEKSLLRFAFFRRKICSTRACPAAILNAGRSR